MEIPKVFADNPLLRDRPLLLSAITRAFKHCGAPNVGEQIVIACPDGYVTIQRRSEAQYCLDMFNTLYIKSDETITNMFKISVPNLDGPPARVN